MNRRILVIDDNPSIHHDFKKTLMPKTDSVDKNFIELEKQLFGKTSHVESPFAPGEEITYQIDSAFQGQEGLKMAQDAAKRESPYALIFVDIRMPPGWDGIKTVQNIWKSLPYTEIVLCTAYSEYTSEDIVKALNVSHRLLFLKKPFDAVAVKQMALAITTKWNLENQARNYLQDLESTVQQRTLELKETVAKLTKTNSDLDESIQELHNAQSSLVQSNKMAALGEMAAGIAHEINNPLCIIQLHAEKIQEYVDQNKIVKHLITKASCEIQNTVHRIAKIVKGLKTFSRDANNDHFLATNVESIVQDALSFCMERFTNHEVSFEFKFDSRLKDAEIQCRATQISQLILNLLNNSYDAIQTLSEKWICLEVLDRDSTIEISVTDSGKGIPPSVRERMFLPFFTTKEVGKGTGLGLSISIGIAESHHGKLLVDSSCKNTRLVLILPKAHVSTTGKSK